MDEFKKFLNDYEIDNNETDLKKAFEDMALAFWKESAKIHTERERKRIVDDLRETAKGYRDLRVNGGELCDLLADQFEKERNE